MNLQGFPRSRAFARVASSALRPSAWMIGLAMLFFSTPASAGQWVYGTVDIVEDYAGYAGGTLGVLVTLQDKVWGGGDSSNGATACTERFSIVAGQQGVDEHSKDRMFSILLTAAATRERVSLFVDTAGPYCKVIIASYGR